jgi:hypothetical protein
MKKITHPALPGANYRSYRPMKGRYRAGRGKVKMRQHLRPLRLAYDSVMKSKKKG